MTNLNRGTARLGAIRGLDLGEYHPDEQYVEYKHRPDEDTPLKNDANGERAVSLPTRAVEVTDGYIEKNRYDVRDDYGRESLVTSQHGRPSKNAIYVWMCLTTVPCQHSQCPHGSDPDTCEYIDYSKSKPVPVITESPPGQNWCHHVDAKPGYSGRRGCLASERFGVAYREAVRQAKLHRGDGKAKASIP